MDLFDLISRYFWLICIAVAAINFVWAERVDQHEEDTKMDRAQRRRYRAWLWGLSIVPWLVVGYAQLSGAVPKVWSYFRPQDFNPYVWTFYGSIFAIYLISAYWILFRDGARIASELRLMEYSVPGKSGAMSPFWIKVMAVGALPFFALWLWLAWTMDVKVP